MISRLKSFFEKKLVCDFSFPLRLNVLDGSIDFTLTYTCLSYDMALDKVLFAVNCYRSQGCTIKRNDGTYISVPPHFIKNIEILTPHESSTVQR